MSASLAQSRDRVRPLTASCGWDCRRGQHCRASCHKPVCHAEQAWLHLQRVETFSIGRPCTSACKFDRLCGVNITPAVLLAAHEYSYGQRTRCEESTYIVEHKKSETMKRWRRLAAAAITVTNDDQKVRKECLTVCQIGPVCPDYWMAAYGIPRGTANMILAEARSGRFDANLEETRIAKAIKEATKKHNDSDSAAAEMTIQWWEMWLSLEDQMPNEAAIQHRTVVWQTVYDHEYIPDIQWWGICRALSRSRWVHLRGVALRNLSIQFFGHKDGAPDEPLTMLSLVERPKHSNFGICNLCAAAKEKWMAYRRCETLCQPFVATHMLEVVFCFPSTY